MIKRIITRELVLVLPRGIGTVALTLMVLPDESWAVILAWGHRHGHNR